MSADTADMLSEELDWRNWISNMKDYFRSLSIPSWSWSKPPRRTRPPTAPCADAGAGFRNGVDQIVYYPPALPFFRESAFLFLEETELQSLADQLAQIQPFLGALLQDNNLRGLFAMLDNALQAIEAGEDIDMTPCWPS